MLKVSHKTLAIIQTMLYKNAEMKKPGSSCIYIILEIFNTLLKLKGRLCRPIYVGGSRPTCIYGMHSWQYTHVGYMYMPTYVIRMPVFMYYVLLALLKCSETVSLECE